MRLATSEISLTRKEGHRQAESKRELACRCGSIKRANPLICTISMRLRLVNCKLIQYLVRCLKGLSLPNKEGNWLKKKQERFLPPKPKESDM